MEVQPVMIGQGLDVLLCGRVVANVVGDSVAAPPRFRRIADAAERRLRAKGLVAKDLVVKDAVAKDLESR
jgi:hypothetical protein